MIFGGNEMMKFEPPIVGSVIGKMGKSISGKGGNYT